VEQRFIVKYVEKKSSGDQFQLHDSIGHSIHFVIEILWDLSKNILDNPIKSDGTNILDNPIKSDGVMVLTSLIIPSRVMAPLKIITFISFGEIFEATNIVVCKAKKFLCKKHYIPKIDTKYEGSLKTLN
jgi:hypothetical protein